MIKLSKMTDYAVVLLVCMARQERVLLSASALSQQTNLPEPTVAKLLKIASKAGLVSSHRGAQGGYRLDRAIEDIRITEVIEAVDGPIALTTCLESTGEECAIQGCCQMNGRWAPVNAAIKSALQDVTLANMIQKARPA